MWTEGVCICIYTNVCVYPRVDVCTYVYIHIICTYIYICIHIYITRPRVFFIRCMAHLVYSITPLVKCSKAIFKARRSLLPRFSGERQTNFGFKHWLRASENFTSDGIGCTFLGLISRNRVCVEYSKLLISIATIL